LRCIRTGVYARAPVALLPTPGRNGRTASPGVDNAKKGNDDVHLGCQLRQAANMRDARLLFRHDANHMDELRRNFWQFE